MGLIVTARTLIQIGATHIELRATFAFLEERRRKLLDAISTHAVPLYRPPWRGMLTSALADGLENLGQGIAAGFRCLSSAAQALILAPMLFLFSWKLAVAALSLVAPALLASRLRAGALASAGKGWELSKARLTMEAEDFVEGSETHIGNSRIGDAASLLDLGLDRHAGQARAWESAKAIFPPALEWFFFMALAILGGLAAAQGSAKDTGLAGLVPFGALLLLLYRPIREWARHYPPCLLGGQAWSSLRNLEDTVESFPIRRPYAQAAGADIVLKGLRFGYSQERGRLVFEGLSLGLDPCALTWISGRNGSGKSTLLRLLAGVETPQAGSILLPASLSALTSPIGYLSQKAVVEPGWREWSHAYRAAHPTAWGVLDSILGLEGILAKAGFTPGSRHDGGSLRGLSGGERQRLCLARTFASPCGYLLLDEPTTWLSAEDRERIMGDLLAFWRESPADKMGGAAQIPAGSRGAAIVSHEPFLGEFCSRTVRLEEVTSPAAVPTLRSPKIPSAPSRGNLGATS